MKGINNKMRIIKENFNYLYIGIVYYTDRIIYMCSHELKEIEDWLKYNNTINKRILLIDLENNKIINAWKTK